MDGPQATGRPAVARPPTPTTSTRSSACFAEDYVNETPVHPARGFRGREQVRRNWEQIFAFVPDIRAEVLRVAVDGDTVWTEWEMTGTRRDGTAHRMRGVIIFGVRDGVAAWARFYLEPVDEAAATSTTRCAIRSCAGDPRRRRHRPARHAGRGAPASGGLDVRVLTRDPDRAAHLPATRIEIVTGDVRDRASIETGHGRCRPWSCPPCRASPAPAA